MAKLTTKARKKLPSKSFAGPDRSYPINDPSRARNALARVSQHGSPALKAKVRAKVKAKYPGIKQAKQPHPKTNPGFYDTEPHVPASKIANRPGIRYAGLETPKPKMVPGAPGRSSAFGGAAHSFSHPPAGGAHGYGHSTIQRLGSIRISGVKGAHRLGKR